MRDFPGAMVGLAFLISGYLLPGALCHFSKVDFPTSMKVMKDFCVTIPCSFESEDEDALNESCRVIWRRSPDGKVVFDSSEKDQTNGFLHGKFRNKDCTTTLNTVSTSNQSLILSLDCGNEMFVEFDKRPVHIIVQVPPQIPSALSCAKTYHQTQCTCESEGNPRPSIKWILGGLPVDPRQNFIVHDEFPNQFTTRSVFTIDVESDKLPTVICHGVNSEGDAYRLNGSPQTGYQAPRILSPPQCTVTTHLVRCACEAEGRPAPSIRWYLNEERFKSRKNFSISDIYLSPTRLRSVLSAYNPPKDFPVVLCLSYNPVGSDKQVLHMLKVENPVPPRILPSSVCLSSAKQVLCTCEVTGTPRPTVQWYLRGERVKQSVNFTLHSMALSDSFVWGSMTVNEPAMEEDIPLIICHSSNSVGDAKWEFFVHNPQAVRNEQAGEVNWFILIPLCATVFASVAITLSLIKINKRHDSTDSLDIGFARLEMELDDDNKRKRRRPTKRPRPEQEPKPVDEQEITLELT